VKKTRKKKAQPFLRMIVLLSLAAGFLIAILSFPFWKISKISVEGTKIVSEGLVKDKARIPLDENIFFLNYGEVAKRIKTIPQIKNVQVSGQLPSGVIIIVEERVPFAVATVSGKYLILDEEGFIIESISEAGSSNDISKARIAELPTVIGLPKGSVVENKKVDPEVMRSIENSFKTLSKVLGKSKFELELVRPDGMNIIVDDVLKVKLGSSEDIDRKLLNMSKILGKKPDKNTIEYIDVSILDNPVVRFKK